MSAVDRPIIDCEEALRRLAEYLDRELHSQARDELDAHLSACRSCFSRMEFESRLRQRLRELGRQPIDPRFERHICELARDFTSS